MNDTSEYTNKASLWYAILRALPLKKITPQALKTVETTKMRGVDFYFISENCTNKIKFHK